MVSFLQQQQKQTNKQKIPENLMYLWIELAPNFFDQACLEFQLGLASDYWLDSSLLWVFSFWNEDPLSRGKLFSWRKEEVQREKLHSTGTGKLSLEFPFRSHVIWSQAKISHQGSILCPHWGMARKERKQELTTVGNSAGIQTQDCLNLNSAVWTTFLF